jgi:hypothetical protein
VIGDSLVPYKYSASFITDPTREILSLGDVIEKEFEDAVRLFLVKTNDFLRVDWVYI